jgi:hypothetical protein
LFRARAARIASFSIVPGFLRHPEAAGSERLVDVLDVAPANATSKSWMMPAPFIASAETNHAPSDQSRTGDRPVLMTWAPIPQTTPALRFFAATIAAAAAIRSAEHCGSESSHVLNDAPR